MIVFAREVFVCKCPTQILGTGMDELDANETRPRPMRFVRGREVDFERLDRRHHGDEDVEQMRARLRRGDYWMIGERGGAIVTYTWLLAAKRASYPSLPGCEIRLRDDCGYGYDAWTPPELRGGGLRRIAFREELRVLRREWGLTWEASFFVKHQLEGATRSLARVGIPITPLWRVWLKPDRTLAAEQLADDDTAVPSFVPTGGAPVESRAARGDGPGG